MARSRVKGWLGLAIYLGVVRPLQAFSRRRAEKAEPKQAPSAPEAEELRLLAEIRDLLERARGPVPQP